MIVDASHKAKEVFTESCNAERIRRALSCNITGLGDIKYITGDTVYYKQTNGRDKPKSKSTQKSSSQK